MRTLPLLASILALGCSQDSAWTSLTETERGAAPYAPTSGADLADRDCTVVLRDLARVSNGTGGYEVNDVDGQRYIVWEGHLDVSTEALADGSEPAVIFNYQGELWWEVEAVADADSPSGYQRYSFWLDEQTPTEGMSLTSLSGVEIQVVPFLRTPEGDRLFDHNRNPGAFDNYLLSSANSWSIADEGAACVPAEERPWAAFELRHDWEEVQHGAVVPGGTLVVEYEPLRLPDCYGDTTMGQATWNTYAYGRFEPGGQEFSGSVIDCGDDARCLAPHMLPLEVEVPEDATSVELWFFTSGRACGTHWDSNYGSNYVLYTEDSPADPVWAGDPGYCLSRGMDQRHEAPESLTIGSWVITRADIRYLDAEVYVPGVSDGSERSELVMARAEVSRDGAEPEHFWMEAEGRVDNNLRYSWELFDVDMVYTPWDVFEVELQFSTDGLEWTPVGPFWLERGEDWCPESYWGEDWCGED